MRQFVYTVPQSMAKCVYRDRLYRFFRRNPTAPAWEIFKAQRNRVVWLQRKAKIDYYQQLLAKKPHPSSIWNTLKLATGSSVSTDNWSSFNSDTTSIANNCGLGVLNKKLVNSKPSLTSLAEQFCASVKTIQLLLLAENWVYQLWLQGENFTPPKWFSSACLQTLPPIYPSFSPTLLLTTTLALPLLLN